MKTLQFEAVKMEMKQNKNGYILTMCLHPDEVPEDLFRDFVGARYQVVMVRINPDESPMERHEEPKRESEHVRLAGMICRDKAFWNYLYDDCLIIEPSEEEATEWLREYLGIQSRTELKDNLEAQAQLDSINKEFLAWKQKS